MYLIHRHVTPVSGPSGHRGRLRAPLALVHALGDDIPVPGCGEEGADRHVTVGEVLRALDTGESLVEIEDEDATVRIWVE